MFFPEKIKSIKPDDWVLEIGPGGSPHPRADIFLELDPKLFEDKEEESFQRGHASRLKIDKPVVYYDGKNFPFKDREFDYVICSHVLEHVGDVMLFLSEMFRVGSKGYLEYPTVYYEYLYNFSVHLNFLKFEEDRLFYLLKSKTSLSDFRQVQGLFYDTLVSGHTKIIDDLKYIFFEGFEWLEPFEIKEAKSVADLVFDRYEIIKPHPPPAVETSLNILDLTKVFLRKVLKG